MFQSITYGQTDLRGVLEHFKDRIDNNPNHEYLIAVGTDSQNHSKGTKFASVIMLHDVGNGGIYFSQINWEERIPVVYNRMMREAQLSLELAQRLIDLIEDEFMNDRFDLTTYNIKFEVHCDLGPNGKSRTALTDALSWIRSCMPADVRVLSKPDSPAASHIADGLTK